MNIPAHVLPRKQDIWMAYWYEKRAEETQDRLHAIEEATTKMEMRAAEAASNAMDLMLRRQNHPLLGWRQCMVEAERLMKLSELRAYAAQRLEAYGQAHHQVLCAHRRDLAACRQRITTAYMAILKAEPF